MAALKEAGWRLTEEGEKLCGGSIKTALDSDIRDIGAECLPEDINRGKATVLEGGFVLQVVRVEQMSYAEISKLPSNVNNKAKNTVEVTKIRNISAPKANEESQANARMLKISLTDGKTTIHGVELTKIDGISLNTPPGTKVKLADSIPISNGFLRLEPGSLKVLGGRVESLYDKWDTSRKLAKFTRNFARNSNRTAENGDSNGPPAWIPFGKKVKNYQNQEADRNFKALPAAVAETGNGGNAGNAKENEEFDSQRQDLIKEAAKAGGQKVFGGGTKEIKEGKTERRGKGRRDNKANGHEQTNNQEDGSDQTNTRDSNRSKKDQEDTSNPRDRKKGDREHEDRGDRDRGDRGGRGGRRGGRGDRGETRGGNRGNHDAQEHSDYSQTKPSSGVSLFDFMEGKIPGGGNSSKESEKRSQPQKEVSQPSRSDKRDNNKERPRRENQRNGHQAGNSKENNSRPNNRNNEGSSKGPRGDRSDRDHRGDRGDHRGDRSDQRGDRNDHRGDRNDHRGDRGDRGKNRGDRNNDRNNGNNQRNNPRSQQTNANNGPDFEAPVPQQQEGQGHGGQGGRRGGHRGQGGAKGGSSDRDFGEWSNSTYHESQMQRSHHHQEALSSIAATLNQMNLNSQKQPQNQPQGQDHPHPHQRRGGHDRGGPPHHQDQHHYPHYNGAPPPAAPSAAASGWPAPPPRHPQWQEHAPQEPQVTPNHYHGPPLSGHPPRWHVGDFCLAKYWEDEKFYPVKVTAVSNKTAVVLFTDYGNHEEVLLGDLQPFPQVNQHSAVPPPQQAALGRPGYIPATAGLPPAFPQS